MDEFCSGFAASLRGFIYKARLDGCVAMDAPPRVGDRKVKNRRNRDSCHVSRGKSKPDLLNVSRRPARCALKNDQRTRSLCYIPNQTMMKSLRHGVQSIKFNPPS